MREYTASNVSIVVDKFCGPGEFSGGDKDFDGSRVNVTVHSWISYSSGCINFYVRATFAEANSDWTTGVATRSKKGCGNPSVCKILTPTEHTFKKQVQGCDQWRTYYGNSSMLVKQIKYLADTDGEDVGNCEPVGTGSGSGAIVSFNMVKLLCKVNP